MYHTELRCTATHNTVLFKTIKYTTVHCCNAMYCTAVTPLDKLTSSVIYIYIYIYIYMLNPNKM